MTIPWLDPAASPYFPSTGTALEEPNGLLAAGGNLSVDWLKVAYRQGIFPWFSEGEPILWWSPAPRTVLTPENLHISRSMQKFLTKSPFVITQNRCFDRVINACAEPRPGQPETWINAEMIQAYNAFHQAGFASSYECWDDQGVLQGGLYGVHLGKVFYGESMFSRTSNASKCCLIELVLNSDYELIDCQMKTDHLTSMGAREISRQHFEKELSLWV